MPGLTSSGFERKTLAQILDSLDTRARAAFGANFNTNDDSVYRQIAGSFALELDELWQANQEAYLAYTRTGAEGVHLDNYFNILGVQRLDASAANGPVLIETDERLQTSLTFTSRRFSLDNSSVRFLSTETVLGQTNTFAYTLSVEQLETDQTYTVNLVDRSATLQTLTSSSLTDDTAKRGFLDDLSTFFLSHIADAAGRVHRVGDTLYIGFNTNTSFNILQTAVDFNITPLVGRRYGRVDITATETGRNIVPPSTEFRITPNFLGFVRAVTYEDFNPGRNVETDAEFRVRGANSLRSRAIGTEDAVVQQLRELEGVRAVRLYQNVTNIPTTQVPQSWSYHVVVAGGVDEQIAEILHTYGPLNVAQYGTTSVSVRNSGGGTSVQRFSDATIRNIDIRISYTTTDGSALNTDEEDAITTSLLSARNSLQIASELNDFTLTRAVLCPVGRFDSLTIETKAEGADDSTYTSGDVSAGPFDLFDFGSDNIFFRRV